MNNLAPPAGVAPLANLSGGSAHLPYDPTFGSLPAFSRQQRSPLQRFASVGEEHIIKRGDTCLVHVHHLNSAQVINAPIRHTYVSVPCESVLRRRPVASPAETLPRSASARSPATAPADRAATSARALSTTESTLTSTSTTSRVATAATTASPRQAAGPDGLCEQSRLVSVGIGLNIAMRKETVRVPCEETKAPRKWCTIL